MARSRPSSGLIPALFCLVGLAFFFQPELASGFRRMQWDFGDTRLHNYILEHGYRWLTGFFAGQGAPLWNPLFFYPTENAMCFTDTMLGTLPIYTFWRLLSLAPASAMQAWMISMTVLNFASMLLLLSGPLRFGALASSAGAFLFAFAYPRAIQLGHPQLLQQFPMVLAVYSLWRFYSVRPPQRLKWVAAFFACAVMLLYSSFYLGWFLIFGTGIAALFALVGKERRALVAPFQAEWPKILAVGAVAALCVLPLALHYLAAARLVGLRPFQATYQPRLLSWLYLGPESPLYSWQDLIKSFRVLGTFGPEQKVGMGWVTTVLVFLGWSSLRKEKGGVRVIGLTAIALFFLATELVPGARLWWIVYEAVPGAKALRALPRVSFVLLLPAAVGVARFFSRPFKMRALAFTLLALLILEQAHRGESFDKEAVASDVLALQQRIGKGCQSFFYSPRGTRETLAPSFKYQLDAMWASLESGVPTVNGYSGAAPLQWDLWENRILDENDRVHLERGLREWARVKNQNFDSICWID